MRVVHLEVSTDSPIQGIRRFVCRQEKVTKVISYNESFSANKVLKSSVSDLAQTSDLKDKLSLMDIDIEWFFNPPAAPHSDGSWERLVHVFKLSLYKIIGLQTMYDKTLINFIRKLESSLNSRPLTNVPVDITDTLPLDPNHFLFGRHSINVPPGIFLDKSVTLSKSWRVEQLLAQQF